MSLPDALAVFQSAHSEWIKVDYQLHCQESGLRKLEERMKNGEAWIAQRRHFPADKLTPARILLDKLEQEAMICRADILEVAPRVDAAREAMDTAEDAALKAAGIASGHVCRFCGVPVSWDDWVKHGATCVVEGKAND